MSISILRAGVCWLARLTVAGGQGDVAVRAIESALRETATEWPVQSFTVYETAAGTELWLHEVSPGPDAGEGSSPLLVPMAMRACAAAAVSEPIVLALAPVRETASGDAAAPVVAAGQTTEKLVIWCRLTAAGSRERLLAALEPLMRAFDPDPGTEIFTLYVSSDDPAAVWMHEVYADRAAFSEHGRSRAGMAERETAEAALQAALAAAPDNTYVRPLLEYRPGRPLSLASRRADAG
jgi:quinol monooxygenase YgiN